MFSITSLRLYGLKSILIALGSISCVSMMQTPAEAATLYVPSSQYPTIQSAINAANRGDTIIVEAGRTYTENLVLRYKSAGTGYVTIQSSALASLPAAGNRVTPADAANMPRIQSTNVDSAVISTSLESGNPAAYYRLIGLEISRPAGTGTHYGLVVLESPNQNSPSKVPHNITIDRCYIHGLDNTGTRRGISLQSRDTQIINNYISKIHEVGADSQAIGGWNGPGGYLISNNYLEAGSENIMFGGATPLIPGLVPSDIVIEKNHIFKPLSWQGRSPSWQIKNLLEIKSGKNITIQHNILENNWPDGDNGQSIVLTPRGSFPTNSPETVENITIRFNHLKNITAGITILTEDYYVPTKVIRNIEISNNLLELNGDWRTIFINQGGSQIAQNVVIDHNTFIQARSSVFFDFIHDGSRYINGFVLNNNIVTGNGDVGSVIGYHGIGSAALAGATVGNSYTFNKNAFRRSSSGYPSSSFYPLSTASYRFVDYANGQYALRSDSPYKNAGTDGKDIGANITELNARTACVVSGRQSDCAAATSSAAYDFDGDGKSDASLYRPTDGVWYLNRSRDGSTGVNFGISTDKIAPADYDGDGKTDVAVFRPEQNIWYVLNSSNWSVSVRYFGSVGDVPVHADYDADGKADFAVWRPSNGVWYRFNSSDGQFVAAQFGLAGDRPAAGDYDGDGRSDLAVYRPTTGVWYLLRSTDGFAAFTFGLPGDVVTPADYTGDGRTDIAVYRPSNGTWYRFDQSNGQMSVFQFGLATDVPTPGDYDGDGKSDLAVYRPSNGTWYFQMTTEGFSTLRYGNLTDVPLSSALR